MRARATRDIPANSHCEGAHAPRTVVAPAALYATHDTNFSEVLLAGHVGRRGRRVWTSCCCALRGPPATLGLREPVSAPCAVVVTSDLFARDPSALASCACCYNNCLGGRRRPRLRLRPTTRAPQTKFRAIMQGPRARVAARSVLHERRCGNVYDISSSADSTRGQRRIRAALRPARSAQSRQTHVMDARNACARAHMRGSRAAAALSGACTVGEGTTLRGSVLARARRLIGRRSENATKDLHGLDVSRAQDRRRRERGEIGTGPCPRGHVPPEKKFSRAWRWARIFFSDTCHVEHVFVCHGETDFDFERDVVAERAGP